MASRRPVDEWSFIVQKQAELNKQLEQEEIARLQQDKGSYRQDLLFQQQLRDQQRFQDRQERDLDAQDVQQRVQIFQNHEQQRRQQEAQLKKQFAEDYRNHDTFLKQRQEDEKRQKQQEEQAHLRLVQQQIEQEKRKERETRQLLQREDQMVKQYMKQQEMHKKQEREQDRLYEVSLAEQRAQQELRKEQGYRDYYRQLDQSQQQKVKQFSQAVSSQNERALQINMWIDKNYREQQALLKQKEDYERRMRENNLRNVNNTLKNQIQEREMNRRIVANEFQREANEMSMRTTQFRRIEEAKEKERRTQQMEYRQHLNAQAAVNVDNRMSAYKLSEMEKKMNRQVLHETPLVRGGAQIMRANQSADRIRAPGIQDSADKFYGVTNSPVPMNRSASKPVNRKPAGPPFAAIFGGQQGLYKNN